VNYGEADRILDLITPEGKLAVIAKGARREKSRMAGGIELFSVSDVVVRRKREEGLGILTSVRLVEFYGEEIVSDYDRLELAYGVLGEVNRRAEGLMGADFYELCWQVIEGLGRGREIEVVRAWYALNLLRVSGAGINLHRDRAGDKLVEGARYDWDGVERALYRADEGKIGTNEIKMMRLMMSSGLKLSGKVPGIAGVWPVVERVVRA
jgi:DNA repair protein RecO (recombination protein O)